MVENLDKQHDAEDEEKIGSYSFIKDPIMEPYYVRIEGDQFALMKSAGGKYKDYPLGYYSQLSTLIRKLVMLQTVNELPTRTYTLKGFIDKIDKRHQEIIDLLKM